MIRDMPLTGIGLDSYTLVQTQFYPGHLLGPEIHAHNLLMQLTLDMGVGGLLGFLWLIAAFAAGVIKALRRGPEPGERALLAGAAVGVVAMLGAGLIDSLWTLKPVVVFWLLLGTGILAARAVAERSGSKTPLSFARRWHAVAGIAAAEAFVVLAVHTGVWQTNTGLVQAHKALVAARTTATIDAGAETRAGCARRATSSLRPRNRHPATCSSTTKSPVSTPGWARTQPPWTPCASEWRSTPPTPWFTTRHGRPGGGSS